MKYPLAFVILALAALSLPGCGDDADTQAVSRIIAEYEDAKVKPDYMTQFARIDVSDAPQDFRLAWVDCVSAWEASNYNYAEDDFLDFTNPRFAPIKSAQLRLYTVAADYVPEIREEQRRATESFDNFQDLVDEAQAE